MTTHGEIVVPKFFDRNGPSGWYSQSWMSRADQSLSSTMPNQSSSACAIDIGVPSGLPAPDQHAELELVVEPARRSEHRRLGLGQHQLAARAVHPCPLTPIDDTRPW